ncbi:hypothetical protein MTO96_008910 [Rhipicephalus appendiculatus]
MNSLPAVRSSTPSGDFSKRALFWGATGLSRTLVLRRVAQSSRALLFVVSIEGKPHLNKAFRDAVGVTRLPTMKASHTAADHEGQLS